MACIYEDLEQLIQDFGVFERTVGAIKSHKPRRASQVLSLLRGVASRALSPGGESIRVRASPLEFFSLSLCWEPWTHTGNINHSTSYNAR